MAQMFESAGLLEYDRVITYCGGGVNASMNCFALSMYGLDNVSLYDGSLVEWCQSQSLPMETG